MGNLDDAVAHFEDALAFCRKAGYRPELAWASYDYATFLHRQGEGEKALTLLEEAEDVSTELGMRPLLDRVIALKEQTETQPSAAPEYPDGLTEREIEVLRLVASGKSNREIGDELFISLNTVACHVSNIFSKTGSANRADAATYANQQGLITKSSRPISYSDDSGRFAASTTSSPDNIGTAICPVDSIPTCLSGVNRNPVRQLRHTSPVISNYSSQPTQAPTPVSLH